MRLLPILLTLACSEYGIQEEVPDERPGDTAALEVDTQEDEPEECSIVLAEAGKVEPAKLCEAPEVTVVDPWNVEMEWVWEGVVEDTAVREVIAMPAIAMNSHCHRGRGPPWISHVRSGSGSLIGWTYLGRDGNRTMWLLVTK